MLEDGAACCGVCVEEEEEEERVGLGQWGWVSRGCVEESPGGVRR